MYDIARDFLPSVMYFAQNIILTITVIFALRAIKENKENINSQNVSQKNIFNKRKALDLIIHLQEDDKFQSSRRVIVAMKNDGINSGKIVGVQKKDMSEEDFKKNSGRAIACQYLLNKLSVISLGIKKEVVDKNTFKRYYYYSYIELVDYLKLYVYAFRQLARETIKNKTHVSHETLYQDILWLMEKWRNSPLEKISTDFSNQ